MKKTLLGTLAIVAAGIANGAPPLELKGIPLGITPRQLDDIYPKLGCAQKKAEPTMFCGYILATKPENAIPELETVAGGPVRAWTFKFVHGKLENVAVSFANAGFEPVAKALRDKYGPGKVTDSQINAKGGSGKLNQQLQRWTEGDMEIVAQRYILGDPAVSGVMLARVAAPAKK